MYSVSTPESAFTGRPEHWHQIDWRRVLRNVREIQIRIAKATLEGDWRRVKQLQRFLTRSFCGRALAVRRVTENRGKATPGVDGETWSTPEQKWQAISRMSRHGYQPKPLRRVYIPKSNGKQRPLGIPTLLDRAMQALHLLALMPISETTADRHSYGFRPERCTADAIEQCFVNLSRSNSAQWVMEGDIKGCFDNIDHDWLVRHIPMDKAVLKKWLKSGVVEFGRFQATDAGTPQGGIISPTLANMALDGLGRELEAAFGEKNTKKSYRTKVNFVRYADDFVITGISKELLENEVKPLVIGFLAQRGLMLSEEKTKLTHIEDGFDFLGWNVRKYGAKLLVKPSKDNTKRFLVKVKEVISRHRASPQVALIRELNPVIRGWCYYHRSQVASEAFSRVDTKIWEKLWRWARRRHPNKPRTWVKAKYFHSEGGRNWVFKAIQAGKAGQDAFDVKLYEASQTKISRHTKIKAEANPFALTWELYLEQRRNNVMLGKLDYLTRIVSLMRLQQGACAFCRHALTEETGWHVHHLLERARGGGDQLYNLRLLHPNCHQQVHHQKVLVA